MAGLQPALTTGGLDIKFSQKGLPIHSRASFYGGLIVLLQTSPESTNIFRLFQRINHAQTMEDLKSAVVGKNDVTDEDFKSFLVYGSGVYANMGNYMGFGDTKIVPDMLPENFESIVKGDF